MFDIEVVVIGCLDLDVFELVPWNYLACSNRTNHVFTAIEQEKQATTSWRTPGCHYALYIPQALPSFSPLLAL